MKGIDIFCASQASTAVCLSMDQPSSSSFSSSSSNTTQLGGRAIDRHNPIITDPRRTPSRDFISPSSSSQPPLNPKPLHDHLQKVKKNSTSKPSGQKKKNATKGHDQKKKSTAGKLTEHITTNNYSSKPIDSILRRSWVRPPSGLITPPGSSRYLLGETPSLDRVSVYDPVLDFTDVDKEEIQVLHHDETNHSSKPSSSSLPKTGSSDQVRFLVLDKTCMLFLMCYLYCYSFRIRVSNLHNSLLQITVHELLR